MDLILWHGGRNLEYNYKENIPVTKNRWEYGPGLYLTTHYETAFKYAKGGGSTYKINITIDETKNIYNVNLPINSILSFIDSYIIKKFRKDILTDIYSNMKRLNLIDYVNAETFLNLIINYQAITPKNSLNLIEFLVDNNIDYLKSDNFSGRDETIFCVINKKIINNVKKVPSKEINLQDYIVDLSVLNKKNKL